MIRGVSTLARFSSKLCDIKINIKDEGLSNTFCSFKKEWLPSNKTALTVAWIIFSIMIGELIIYKHQDFFSSYVSSASDFSVMANENVKSSDNREKYDNQVNSNSKLYQNILSRYAVEHNNKESVKKQDNGIANEPATLEPAAVEPEAIEPAAIRSIEEDSLDSPSREAEKSRVIVHRVKNGETLAQISKKYFKTTSKFKEIARQNNLKIPYSVKSGDKLLIVTQ